MKPGRRVVALAFAALLVPTLAKGAGKPTVASPALSPALAQVEAARALRQAGDRHGADEALDRAIEIDPNCGVTWLERGLLAESSSSTLFARARARRAIARAFELDPTLVDPLRHPEIRGSRAALAVEIESWRRPASTERAAATTPAAASASAHPRTPAPAARKSQVIDASALAGSGPVNQVLPAGSGASVRNAAGRRGARAQRFHPPPMAQPQPEPEPEPAIENSEEAPPPDEAGDQAVEEEQPSQDTSGDTATEEPPPGSY